MKIIIVTATGEDGGIGYSGKTPWNLPLEMGLFKSITRHKTIVMGRKTHESIGYLKDRHNIVMTRQKYYQARNCETARSLTPLLSRKNDLYIIGGGEIYKLFIPYATDIYLSKVHSKFKTDAFFYPNLGRWEMVSSQYYPFSVTNRYDFTHFHYKKFL